MKRAIRRKSWFNLARIGFILLFQFCLSSVGLAQIEETIQWSPVENISQTPDNCSVAADIQADITGRVHLVWGGCSNNDLSLLSPDTIYYSQWDGQSWSTPVDIVYQPGDGAASLPRLVVGRSGLLHLVFVGDTNSVVGNLLYTKAPASQAANARYWSQPVMLAEGWVDGASFELDDQDCLHLAYGVYSTANILYIRSCDQGMSWSSPVVVYQSSTPNRAMYPRLAVDGQGRLHIAFTEVTGEYSNGGEVYYARSIDGGDTWDVLPVDPPHPAEYSTSYGPHHINLLAVGNGQLHLVWDGPPSGQRWHQWSKNGGETWSNPVQIDPDVRQITWPSALVADSMGVMHLFTVGGAPGMKPPTGGMYHAAWRNGMWSSLVLVDSRRELDFHEVSATVALGQDFHVVYQNHGVNSSTKLFEIWHVSGHSVEAPALPAKAFKRNNLSETTSEPAVNEANALSTPTSMAKMPLGNTGSAKVSNPHILIAVAILPVVLLILVVGGGRLWVRRR